MNIINEAKYQFKKVRDRWVFNHFYLKKITKTTESVSKTILIIRLDAIGDCIIWLDQAKEYRKTFPNHRLVLLHNKAWGEIAEKTHLFDEYISFDRNRICDIKYYKKLIDRINKYHYEKVFSPVFSRDFFTVDWIVHNVNAQEKLGFEGDYQNSHWIASYNLYYRAHYSKINLKKVADCWYTTLVSNNGCGIMELQRNAHFVRQTFNNKFQSHLPTITFAKEQPSTIPASKYVVFFLGASTIHRTWPTEFFAQIAQNISFQTLVLCGSASDMELSAEFVSVYQGKQNVINLTGKTSLIELINIIAHAELVLTNETSASHIAVATRTPSICLLGGGHYGRFQPYQVEVTSELDRNILPFIVSCEDKSCFGCNWNCKHPYINNRWRCIANISTNDVIQAIILITNNNRS